MGVLDAYLGASAGDSDNDAGDSLEEAALVDAIARAKSTWPEIDVDDAAFAAYLGERGVEPSCSHLADLWLAHGCLVGDQHAVDAFERTIVSALSQVIGRIDSSASFVSDLLAEVRVKLVVGQTGKPAALTRYVGYGPLRSFAMVVAMREATDRKRSAGKEVAADDLLLAMPFVGASPETVQLRDQLRDPFSRAFKAALGELSARERNILRLHFSEGVSADAIGKVYRVHRSTIHRWIDAARERVIAETRRRLMDDLKLGRDALDSLMVEVADGVDLTLSTFLQE